MRVSVALCTRDGERFIGELLNSIGRQSRAPNELVIGDDGSRDETLAVIRSFADSACFPVHVERSGTPRGVTANFSATVSRCEGDAIVLCDQDDIWLPTKLLELERALEAPGVTAAFSDAELVGPEGAPLGTTLWAELAFDEDVQARMGSGDTLGILLKQNVITGATLAVSSEVARVALPFPCHGLHDVWLAWIAACLGTVVPIPIPLVRYRQHGSNVVGAPVRSLRRRLAHRVGLGDVSAAEADHLRALVERLRLVNTVDEAILGQVEGKIAHLQVRSGLPARRPLRFGPVVREVRRGGYARYARGWHSILFDLFFRTTASEPRGRDGAPL